MNLRISVEKLCDFKGVKFVSLYLERSKKFLEKTSICFGYLRKWFDFSSFGSQGGACKTKNEIWPETPYGTGAITCDIADEN
jgi:hypothetical protein